MKRAAVGIILIMFCMVSIESERVWIPILAGLIGSVLLIWGANADEKKNNIHDYTSRDDSRPYFLH